MSGVTILLAAAGASSRMRGADKLLERIDGVALLRRQAMAALATGCPVIVALPPLAQARLAVLAGLDVAIVEVADADTGMGATLRAGAQAAGQPLGLMVMLADMPDLGTDDLTSLIAGFNARPDTILRAGAGDGTPGHPILFPRACLPGFATLSGDTGARRILSNHAVRTLPLPGQRAITDLDTPEAWAEWRARRR